MKPSIAIILLSLSFGYSLLADEKSDREANRIKRERLERLEENEKLCNLEKTEDACFKKTACIWIVHKTLCQFKGEKDYKIPKRPIHKKGIDE